MVKNTSRRVSDALLHLTLRDESGPWSARQTRSPDPNTGLLLLTTRAMTEARRFEEARRSMALAAQLYRATTGFAPSMSSRRAAKASVEAGPTPWRRAGNARTRLTETTKSRRTTETIN